MKDWAYSAHWADEVVTISVTVQADTKAEAIARGRARLRQLFATGLRPEDFRQHEMAADVLEYLASGR